MRSALCRVSAGEHNQYWERHNCLHLDRSSPAMCSACLVKLNICCSISLLAGLCWPWVCVCVGGYTDTGDSRAVPRTSLMDFHFPSWTCWTVHVYGAGYLMAIEQLACFLKTHPRSVFVGQSHFFENVAQKLTSWTHSYEVTRGQEAEGGPDLVMLGGAFITHRLQLQPWGLSMGLINRSKTYCVADCNLCSSD